MQYSIAPTSPWPPTSLAGKAYQHTHIVTQVCFEYKVDAFLAQVGLAVHLVTTGAGFIVNGSVGKLKYALVALPVITSRLHPLQVTHGHLATGRPNNVEHHNKSLYQDCIYW